VKLADRVRAGEWWEHKLAPILGTGYATAYVLHQGMVGVAPDLLLALLALACGAAYVSLLNDLTDLEADRLSGKHNRAEGRSTGRTVLAVAVCVAAGWVTALLAWRDDGTVLLLYGGAWVAFTLYSAAPVRLKGRGLAGVLADGAGSHFFPHLFVTAVVFAHADAAGHTLWVVLVAVWATALGLRGALIHQLRDIPADRAAGTATFAVRHPRPASQLGRFVAFPFETAAFCAMAIHSGNLAAVGAIAFYLVLEPARTRRWGAALVVAGPPPPGPHRFIMLELYETLYPLVYLAAAVLRSPWDASVLVVHTVLFGRGPARVLRESRDEFYLLRRRVDHRLVRAGRLAP
jgi:4-hydroxybenzoate polyprenyltransferase